MLTDEEMSIVLDLFTSGPAVLRDHGIYGDAVDVFLNRNDVRAELASLQQEHESGAVLGSRTRFIGKRYLSRLLQPATAVIATALAGPSYKLDADGRYVMGIKGEPIKESPEPTRKQMDAAKQILNRIGVMHSDRPQIEVTVNAKAEAMFARKSDDDREFLSELDKGKDPDVRALSHERILNAIHGISTALRDAVIAAVPATEDSESNVKKPVKQKKAKKPKPAKKPVIRKSKKAKA